MMKEYQEALNTMCNRCMNNEMCMGTGCSPKEVLQELVDRATPKKVWETDSAYLCRNCCTIFSMKYEGMCIECLKSVKVCASCGQAIDWSVLDD